MFCRSLFVRDASRSDDLLHEFGRCLWCAFFERTRQVHRKQTEFLTENMNVYNSMKCVIFDYVTQVDLRVAEIPFEIVDD